MCKTIPEKDTIWYKVSLKSFSVDASFADVQAATFTIAPPPPLQDFEMSADNKTDAPSLLHCRDFGVHFL